MGAGGASTGGGGGNNNKSANNVPPSRRNKTNKFTNLTKDVTNPNDDTDAKLDMFNKGKKGNAKGTLALLNPVFEKGSEVTRNFYTTRVLKGKDLENFKSKSVTEQEAQYKSYLDGRLSGKTDAMGRKIISTGNDNQVVQAPLKATTMPVKGPTEAEVDQSSATDTTAVDDIYTRKRKTKARGRSMMTLTGPRGLSKDEKLTLGRPSLLGS